jgi:hypothetical protein
MMREGAPLDDIVCDAFLGSQPPELGPDGRHVAYGCVRRAGEGVADEVFVVQDGLRHGPYGQVWGIALSDDGRRVAYGAWDGSEERGWGLYVDGVRRPGRFGAVWRPRLFPNGVHLAWQAQPVQDGPGVLGVDHWQLAGFDAVVWGPEFDAEGRVAWVIRRGRRLVRIDVSLPDAG